MESEILIEFMFCCFYSRAFSVVQYSRKSSIVPAPRINNAVSFELIAIVANIVV